MHGTNWLKIIAMNVKVIIFCVLLLLCSVSIILFFVVRKIIDTQNQADEHSPDKPENGTEESYENGPNRVWDETVGADNGAENALWYFREDVLANSHHRLWHASVRQKPIHLRGELFYFMHHEVIARYAAARLGAGMPPVVSLALVSGSPLGGYKSHLSEWSAGETYDDRPEGTRLSDLQDWGLTIAFLEETRQFVLGDIQRGFYKDSTGQDVSLSNKEGIDYLGELVFMNHTDYDRGSRFLALHGLTHGAVARSANTNGTVETFGVMAMGSTAFRDPVFYQLHQFIDNLLLAHKDTLEPYGLTRSEYPLKWDGVIIEDIQLSLETSLQPVSQLETFWDVDSYDLIRGIDWFVNNTIRAPEPVRQKHLNYKHFTYTITLNVGANVTGGSATVRIFLAPRFNGEGQRYSMNEQRRLFLTLDRFKVKVNGGVNFIRRRSVDSAYTIPARAWVENIRLTINDECCGCGWPSHLLLPKGTRDGMPFDLFVMVTNGDDDTVVDNREEFDGVCYMSSILCPLHHEKYSDVRPMGYPFDRRPYSVAEGNSSRMVKDLEEYVKYVPNMKAVQVRIVHLH